MLVNIYELIMETISKMTIAKPTSQELLQEPTREEIGIMLRNAGILAPPIKVPRGARQLTDAELEALGRVPPGTPTTTQMISEDRGSY